MKKVVLASLVLLAPVANAGVSGDSLGKCLVSSSSDQVPAGAENFYKHIDFGDLQKELEIAPSKS